MTSGDVLHVGWVIAAWAGAALLVGWLSGMATGWVGRRRHNRLLCLLSSRCRRAWIVLLVIYALYTVLPVGGAAGQAARQALLLALIGTTAWFVLCVLHVAEDMTFLRLRPDVKGNRRIRRVRTQVGVLRRLTSALVTMLALGAMLMNFSTLRTLGASLLASAGVAGAIAGLAAQTTLRNVLAGLQLALADQLRLDDVVVVEHEWGRVEQLTLTHVVVRLWDERRLMIPTAYFITTPFENWTRDQSRVLGAVVLHLDYRAPVGALRAEAGRIVRESPLWDRRDWIFQVVDSTPSTMVVRVLASAADGPSAWDLRCDIREALIAYLAAEYPAALPRARNDRLVLATGSGLDARGGVGWPDTRRSGSPARS